MLTSLPIFLHHLPRLPPHLLHKLRRSEYLDPASLAEQPHLDPVAVDLRFDQITVVAEPLDDPRGRQLVEHCLYGRTAEREPDRAQLAGPHEQAALAEKSFVKSGDLTGIVGVPVDRDLLDAVNSIIARLFLLHCIVGGKRDQVEIVIRKQHGRRHDPMCDPAAIHPVVFDADLPALQNAVHDFPEIVLHAFTVVVDLRIMVQLLADQFVQLLPVRRGRKPTQLVNDRQQLQLGKRSGADDDLDHGEQFLARQKFIQNQTIAFVAVGVVQLCVPGKLAVLCQKILQFIDTARDAFGGNSVRISELLDVEILSAQSAKKDFKKTMLHCIIHRFVIPHHSGPRQPVFHYILYKSCRTTGCLSEKNITDFDRFRVI